MSAPISYLPPLSLTGKLTSSLAPLVAADYSVAGVAPPHTLVLGARLGATARVGFA